MKELLINNTKLLFINFVIKIVDHGYGISDEGIQKLFINFSKLKEN